VTHDEAAAQLLGAYDAARLAPLLTAQDPSFSLADAFAVGSLLRERRIARGEMPLGYKIGFTNRGIWARYGVHAPIWGPVWNTTASLLPGTEAQVSLAALSQPRLEPEVVFGFARTPRAGMSEAELAACLEWVAHGFEIVHSHHEGWRFQAADCLADGALHGRLFVGPRVPVSRFGDLGPELAALTVELHGPEGLAETGVASIVLDGPLNALRLWVDAMAQHTPGWPIRPGDLVTTGTITDAWPLLPGQRWHTVLSDARLAGLSIQTR
jgi:2-oxo-3-hexenedioate decarboxylase